MSKVLSAVAWPYANGPRHIGHVAGFGVPSDVFSRYMRMAGHDVLMVSGTDEHGTPILVAADKAGVTPRELADRNNRMIVEDLHALGLSYDLFTRTTTRNHHAVVQEMFRTVHRNGYMVEQTTKGAISPSTGRTLPDRYIEGTCPICGYAEARGDQCDNCGNQLDPTDLIDPRSKINGEVPEFVETQHFFLDLPALADALKEWLDEREASGHLAAQRHQVQPEHPRGHPAAGDDPRHRLGHPGAARRLAGQPDQAALRLVRRGHRLPVRVASSGPAASASPTAGGTGGTTRTALSYYFMGKDNITFHSQIWPAELLAYDGTGRPGRRAGGVRRAEPAHRGGLLGVPDDGGQAVLVLAGRGDLRPRRARALPARRAALLHLRGRPGEPGQRLHLGGVRPPHQRRAGRGLGQPGQPHRAR